MKPLLAMGGWVMLPLLLGSVVALTLAAERGWFWWRLGQEEAPLARNVLAIYARDRPAALARLRQRRDLPQARIFLAALELDERPSPSEFRLALRAASQAERPLLRRFDSVLTMIASLAPLLGLLGTVLGLIRSFAPLRLDRLEVAIAPSSSLSQGLAEALVSTATGLGVAVVAVLVASYFRGCDRRYRHQLDRHLKQLERLYQERYWRKDCRLTVGSGWAQGLRPYSQH